MFQQLDFGIALHHLEFTIFLFHHRHILEGHGGWVSDCAVHPTSDTAITVSGDDLAVVWDLISGSCRNVLEGHSGEIMSVVLTRKGRFAVTGSSDGTARIWDLAAGSAHLQRAHAGRVHGLVPTPDSSVVVSFGMPRYEALLCLLGTHVKPKERKK